MSVCEACWTEASVRAALRGGFTVHHYRELIREFHRSTDLVDDVRRRLAGISKLADEAQQLADDLPPLLNGEPS